MKTKLLLACTALALLIMPNANYGQAITLGTAANFVLFSSSGAVSSSGGMSQLTGNVGSNGGSSTGFGNVNGGMHDNDGTSASCMADLHTAYLQLNGATATHFPAPGMGGDTLLAGIYSTSAATTLDNTLCLDAKGNSSAVFIFQIGGSFIAHTGAKVRLLGGALACNVYWKVEGAVSLFSGVFMAGTIVANNAQIIMATGDTLEGRALSTNGAVTVTQVLAYTPIGCGSSVLTGPTAPNLGTTACYGIFTSTGAVSNSGVTHIVGDVGSNSAAPSGFVAADVTGTIHMTPDNATAQCASDLVTVYSYLNTLGSDIELLYPAQFGSNLVLTPHTYTMNAAATLTDTLYLNAEGLASAVFVIQINGALSTSTHANVKLINGALAQNVYWKVEGAVSINNNSTFCGTIVSNNGAVGALNTGVTLHGRILSTAGALSTAAVTANALVSGNCTITGIKGEGEISSENAVNVYPNPFTTTATLVLRDVILVNNAELSIYNILGEEVLHTLLTKQTNTLETGALAAGVYFYKVTNADKTIQTGRLISQK